MSTETLTGTSTDTEATAMTAAPRKEKRSDIRCTPDAKEQFDALYDAAKADGTFTGYKQDFLGFILEQYVNQSKTPMITPKASNKVESELYQDDEDKPQAWFVNISGSTKAERETKYQEIKEALGIEGDIISLTRQELFDKAAELSGKSVEEIIKSGAESEAQTIITSMRKPAVAGQGRGRLGGSDIALDEAFIEIVGMLENGSYVPKGGLPITKISSRAGANFNSAKGWASRRGFEFPMDVEHAIKLSKTLEAK